MRGKTKERDGVYERQDRPGLWISFVDAKGRRRRRKAKGAFTLQEARKALAAEQQNVERERIYGIAPPSPETFSATAARYLKHQIKRLTPAAYERARGVVEKHLKPFFGSTKVGEIRKADIQRYVTQRSGLVSPGTVAREMNVLKRLFSLCLEWEMVVVSPAARVKVAHIPAGRIRYLQPGELRILLAACPEWLRPIVGIAVATGMRLGEILGLRWLEIDRRGERILLPRTKNGELRIVYMNRLAFQVVDLLMSKPHKATDLLFAGLNGRQVSMAFKRAAKTAKIEDFRFHDLRHTAASWLRMQGNDIHTVAALLGHKDLRMAARYQHLSPVFLGDAVKKLDQIFGDDLELPALDAPSSGSIVTVASPTNSAKAAGAS